MGSTTLSSREFNQDASRAKKAAAGGPVFITDRGRPAQQFASLGRTGPAHESSEPISLEVSFDGGGTVAAEWCRWT